MILTEHKDTKTQSFSWHCDQLNSLCLCVFVFKISAEHLSIIPVPITVVIAGVTSATTYEITTTSCIFRPSQQLHVIYFQLLQMGGGYKLPFSFLFVISSFNFRAKLVNNQ